MKFNQVADLLNDFEAKNIDLLLAHETTGWNTWSVIKKPLYNFFRSTSSVTKNPKQAKGYTVLALARLLMLFSLKTIYYSIFKRNSILLVSFNGQRLNRNEKGEYLNPFLDPIILHNLDYGPFLYFEYFANGQVNKQPSAVPCDINMDVKMYFLKILKFFLRIILRKDIAKLSYFEEHFFKQVAVSGVQSKKGIIIKTVLNFLTDYYFHRILFALISPKKILIVDGTPGGLIASAVKMKIPIEEFQHGIIGKNKFEYYVDGRFRKIKSKMPYPDKVLVFGKYFKDLLLETRFWDEKEIVVVGNYSVDTMRLNKQKSALPTENYRILIATQPSVFLESTELVNELMGLKNEKVMFLIKPHPLETNHNIHQYHILATLDERFRVSDPNEPFLDSLYGTHILIGFHSTVLLEAIAVGIPVLTVSTQSFPDGINSYLEGHSKIPIFRNNKDLYYYLNDSMAYNNLKVQCKNQGKYFYDTNFLERMKIQNNSSKRELFPHT